MDKNLSSRCNITQVFQNHKWILKFYTCMHACVKKYFYILYIKLYIWNIMFKIKLIQCVAGNYRNLLSDIALQVYQLKFIYLFFGGIVISGQ